MESLLHVPFLESAFIGNMNAMIASNSYVSGLIMILLNVGTSYLMQDIMPLAQRVFSFVWTRRLVFFAIFFTATRDLVASVILTIIASVLLDVFLNEDSRYCLIPYEYRAHASDAMSRTPQSAVSSSSTEDKRRVEESFIDHHGRSSTASASVSVTRGNPRYRRFVTNAQRWRQLDRTLKNRRTSHTTGQSYF